MLPALLLAALLQVQEPPVPVPVVDAEHRRLTADLADTIGMVGTACALDLWTTAWAFERDPSAGELQPLGQTSAARAALKVAAASATVWFDYQLRARGHRRAAAIFRWIVVGAFVAASANNFVIGFRPVRG